ncbi:hypothetical protein [Desulfovibrio sp. 86]|uniref:Uncharacterized protein n=1 Tax=uncultured Desulfovibrio sp. TaxID=167968 RepID=A0A212KYJ6_9BACT|nr:hypothetical protein [Desulfovibrio sp. 86]SCM70327.1 hypothetical protein KL86DES1_10337 [uncultured Desulfovibrio sp.]VZH32208.1 conserved protein of unknown function [Desulfovibrio sp. 86]
MILKPEKNDQEAATLPRLPFHKKQSIPVQKHLRHETSALFYENGFVASSKKHHYKWQAFL